MCKAITPGEVRPFASAIDRVSICMHETLTYENFDSICDVPHSHDEKYLYEFGIIRSEFREGEGAPWRALPCQEIMLPEKSGYEGGGL